MKTSLTLSTVLFALTLSPAAFANGAQEQTPATAAASTAPASASVAVYTVQQLPQVASIARSVLEQLDVDLRADLLNRLRANSTLVIEALQVAVPALADTAGKPLDLTAR